MPSIGPISHLAFLVPDLEDAIERWTAALGYTFSPVLRYRTARYEDHTGPAHPHDARISVSREEPMIELMEFHGHGTHGAAQAGFHHLGFVDVDDLGARRAEFEEVNVRVDGVSNTAYGVHLWFTNPIDLNGIRLEFVGTSPSPIVFDDLSEVDQTDGFSSGLWPPGTTLGDAPRIHHMGILVDDLEAARERWSAVTGWNFSPIQHYRTDHYRDFSDPEEHHHDARTCMSTDDGVKVELMEFTGRGTHSAALGQGFHHIAFIDHADITALRSRYAELRIRIQGDAQNEAGEDLLYFTHPDDMDGMRMELVDIRRQHPIYEQDGRLVRFNPDGTQILE